MNLKTAASQLSVHYQTAYKLVRSGSLAAVKIGGTYEISDAALERYRAERDALRAAAAAPRDEVGIASRPGDIGIALEELEAVAVSTSTTPHGAFDTAARVGAETIGDACIVVLRTSETYAVVASYDIDPRRRAVLRSLVNAFGSHGPIACFQRVSAAKQPLLISHVPQDRLRATIDAQYLQFLDVVGVHSLALAPVIVDDDVRAIVMLDRATPGAPYGPDDLRFAAQIADSLRLALHRYDAYTAGWRRRGELLETMRHLVSTSPAAADLAALLDEGRFAEVVHAFNGARAANDVSERLTNGQPDTLLGDGANQAVLTAGELEYRDEERDVTVDGVERQFIVHRGLVRDEHAQPRALVVVAQRAPVLARH